MRNIRNFRWALGLALFNRNKALPLGTLMAGIGLLMLLSGVSRASVTFSDTFASSIDSGVWTTAISPTGNPTPADVGTVAWDSGHVEITQSQNFYANIRHSIGAGVQSVSADINNVSDQGISWAPSVVLYFDPTHWVQFSVSDYAAFPNVAFITQVDQGSGPAADITGVGVVPFDTWETLEIKLNPATSKVEFYGGPQGGPLTHIASADTTVPSSFFTDSAYVILGKGYDDNPSISFFQEDNVAGASGVSLYDNVVVESPEPASLGLLVLGGAMLLRRRR